MESLRYFVIDPFAHQRALARPTSAGVFPFEGLNFASFSLNCKVKEEHIIQKITFVFGIRLQVLGPLFQMVTYSGKILT